MSRTVRLGLAGDVMLGRLVDRRQRERGRPPEAVWGTVLEDLRSLDGLVVNLECALSTRGERWTRTYRPFHFRADPGWAVPALRAAGVDACALANNHLLDYGEVALLDTVEHLDRAGVAHAGAGADADAARAPAAFDVAGYRVAVVAFTDNTPEYAAGPDSPGVARVEFDVDDPEATRAVEDALVRAREYDPDLLVASLHWGPNMVTEPPPKFRAFARWLVDRGVDAVHGHSAHVFQGVEVIDGRPVCYDTGDFVDDYAVDDELRNDRSFLFELLVDDGRPAALRLHPVEIEDGAVHRAEGAVSRWCRERMRELSRPFGTAFERADEGLTCDLTR